VRQALDPQRCRVALCAVVAVIVSMSVPAATQTAVDSLERIRSLVDAGALQLALNRIEALQPADTAGARWAQWEALRCELLARLGRYDALLARGASLPERTPLPGICLIESARAAVLQNEPQLARTYAARLLWQSNPTSADVRSARLAVIESYVAEKRGEDAYRSMLRFQQDYQPLERTVTRRFAEALLDLGLDREALNWLGSPDEMTPARLRLQLRSAGLTPDAVVTQARAAFAKTSDPAYWTVVLEAALRQKNPALEVEAREHLLQHRDTRKASVVTESAQRLWQTYLAAASEVGNRERLLVGDDAAWSDYAARRLGAAPFLARAFYAYLAQRAQSADMRHNAQLSLVASLRQAKLDDVALRVMRGSGLPGDALDTQTRYLLGTIAANRNEPGIALEMWGGLQPPPDAKPDEWQLVFARTALRAGDSAASLKAVQRILGGPARLTPELVQSTLDLAQEMVDARSLTEARLVYEALVPLASENRLRETFFGLGRVLELQGEQASAADAYLRSALLAGSPDASALQARLLAGTNLVRAGFRDDARSQFEWILKNTKDPALLDAARRALARL